MNFAVIQSANHGSKISASGPHVRLLGLSLNAHEAETVMAKHSTVETRMIPMSKAPRSAADTDRPLEIHWRTVGCTEYTSVADYHADLETTTHRLSEWTKYREAAETDVVSAARDHRQRPVYTVRAEGLLSMLDVERPGFLEPSSAKNVPNLSRADEIVGQTWAILAIVGDASYELAKQMALEALGRKFFALMCTTTGLTDESDAEAKWYGLDETIREPLMKTFLDTHVTATRDILKNLTEEPMVAMFKASEDPDDLNKTAETLAGHPDMKHADVAVVRMYAWLALRTAKSHRVKHVCKGSAAAKDFFEAMRSAMA